MSVVSAPAHPANPAKRPIQTIVWNALGFIILVALAAFCSNYYLNFFQGPLVVDESYLLAAAEKPATGLIAYVQINDPELIPTGFTEQGLRDEKVYETTPYFFLKVRNQWMLVKTHPEKDGGRLIGPLQSVSAKVDVEVRDALIAKDPTLQAKLLPMIVNGAAAFTVAGYLGLVIFIPAMALCGFNLFRAVASWGHPAITNPPASNRVP